MAQRVDRVRCILVIGDDWRFGPSNYERGVGLGGVVCRFRGQDYCPKKINPQDYTR